MLNQTITLTVSDLVTVVMWMCVLSSLLALMVFACGSVVFSLLVDGVGWMHRRFFPNHYHKARRLLFARYRSRFEK